MKYRQFTRAKSSIGGHGSWKGERGVYIVESAITFSVFLLLMFGVMEFGRAIWAYSSIAHAGREGVRYAIVRGSESGRAVAATDVQDFVRNKAGLSTATVTTTWTPDNNPNSVVQVKVDYNFQPVIPLIPSMSLTSTSRMVISF